VRILIVDDSAVIREKLRSLLERHAGWGVCAEAMNGVDALEKAQECHPDLVLLDVSMPVMNGLECARHLKQFMPSVPLVIFTSYESVHLNREAAAAGVRKVISKDGPVSTLIQALEELLPSELPASASVGNGKKIDSTNSVIPDYGVPIQQSVRYTTGQEILESGIYTVSHQQHRLPHQVTLLKGETFPRCAKCGDLVEFLLDQSAPYVAGNTRFPIRLFALPDLDDGQPTNPLRFGLPK
jgi:DNA-binding NarL/FixJ family response regulator